METGRGTSDPLPVSMHTDARALPDLISWQIFMYGLQLCIMCAMIALEFIETVLMTAIQLGNMLLSRQVLYWDGANGNENSDQVQRRLGCQRQQSPNPSSR